MLDPKREYEKQTSHTELKFWVILLVALNFKYLRWLSFVSQYIIGYLKDWSEDQLYSPINNFLISSEEYCIPEVVSSEQIQFVLPWWESEWVGGCTQKENVTYKVHVPCSSHKHASVLTYNVPGLQIRAKAGRQAARHYQMIATCTAFHLCDTKIAIFTLVVV